MTKDEAIKILQGAIKTPNTKDGYLGQAIDMAIKSLEVWEKIRDEIEETANKIRNIRNDNLCFFTEQDVLEIIDKHLAEVEHDN